jgi:uncharacterized protein (TIGR03083 family)
MNNETYLNAVQTNAALIAKVAAKNLDAPVAACPGWTMAELVWHMGEVLAFWKQVIDKKALNTSDLQWIERPHPRDLMTWYGTSVSDALATLSSTDPSMRCWTWTGEQDVAWIIRRMAHESSIHMWDACTAVGVQAPLDAELSSDGIDEFLYVMVPHVREAQPVVGGSVHLHCTDVEGEWLAVPGEGDQMIITREHAKGSCAIRGSAHDLLLLLWRRIPSFAVEVIGDAAVAERFLMRTSLD